MQIVMSTNQRTGSAWPHDKEWVTYGPFDTKADVEVFHAEGEKRGLFTSDYTMTYMNSPAHPPSHNDTVSAAVVW